MTVQQRRSTTSSHLGMGMTFDSDESKEKLADSRPRRLVWIVCLAILMALYARNELKPPINVQTSLAATKLKIDGQNHLFQTRPLSLQAKLQLYLSRADIGSNTVLLGPHTVVVSVNPTCTFPRFFIRAQGNALVHIALTQRPDNKQWHGVFYLPVNGSYSLDARWYGCTAQDTKSFTSLGEAVAFDAQGVGPPHDSRHPNYYAGKLLARSSAWISTKNIRIGDTQLPPYMWRKVGDTPTPGSFVKTAESLVHQGGAIGPEGFYKFGEVGNYELVCFMGSQTMQKIWRAFMDMRGHLFAHQRPFKFHLYDIYSFVKPDEHWEDDTKRRLRKCKHILLSLDEFKQPLSQQEYKDQVAQFVNVHLQNVIPDKTFPIWVFSVSEPPMNATNCFNPTLPRTTDHPCNDVLKQLFDPDRKAFDERIHFLDNTDLSLPQFDSNHADVLANIALRVYVIVGKGVSVWRHMGQSGKENGLHKNDTVEPNFELIPYEGWN